MVLLGEVGSGDTPVRWRWRRSCQHGTVLIPKQLCWGWNTGVGIPAYNARPSFYSMPGCTLRIREAPPELRPLHLHLCHVCLLSSVLVAKVARRCLQDEKNTRSPQRTSKECSPAANTRLENDFRLATTNRDTKHEGLQNSCELLTRTR